MCLSQFIVDLALITNHANVLSSELTAMLLPSLLGSGIFKMRVAQKYSLDAPLVKKEMLSRAVGISDGA